MKVEEEVGSWRLEVLYSGIRKNLLFIAHCLLFIAHCLLSIVHLLCIMKIDIISVVPELLDSPFAHSIMKRAKDKGLLEVKVINLRDHTNYPRAQVDDYAFGGGAGMVMMIEPLVNAIESLQKETTYDEVIYLTPDGETFNQRMANQLSLKNNREAKAPSDTSSNFNILILGIDRRSGDQTSWRTDVIQLITLNPERTRAVLTHIPRD